MLKLLLILPFVIFFLVFGILGISKHIVIAIIFLTIAACLFFAFCILLGASIFKKRVEKKGFETEAIILGFIDTLAGKYETHDFDEASAHGAYLLRIEYFDEKGEKHIKLTDKVIHGSKACKLKKGDALKIRCKGASIVVIDEKY
ncbi:MAG: hypothetical protein ACI4U5_01620 [Bacilli bacterium]